MNKLSTKITLGIITVLGVLYFNRPLNYEKEKKLALKEFLMEEYEEFFREARDVLEYKLSDSSGFLGLKDLKLYFSFEYQDRVDKVWFEEVYDSEYVTSIAKGAAIAIDLPHINIDQIFVKPRVNRVRVNFYSFILDILIGGVITVSLILILTRIAPFLAPINFVISIIIGILISWLLSIPIDNFANNIALKWVLTDAVKQVISYI